MKQRNKWYRLLLFSGLLILWGCGPEKTEPAEPSLLLSSFYRQDTGFYQDFKVLRVTYQALDTGKGDTSLFYYRYQHIGTVPLEGRRAILIERWQRPDTTLPWTLDSLLLQWSSPLGLFRQSNNTTFHMLPAELKQDITWNRNAFNSRPARICRWQDFDVKRVLGSGLNQKGLEVLVYRIPQNFVSVAEVTEEYRSGIGLYRSFKKEISFAQGNLFGLFVPETGEIYEEQFIGEGEIQ